jgi:hypothetical protein
MSSKGNTLENDWLKLLFTATAIANIADNAAASPATNLYVGLCTANPGEGGDQTTNETAYTNYARVAVARTSGGWTVSSNTVTNAAAINFAQCGATGATLMFWTIGTASSGAGKLLYYGPIGSPKGPFVGENSNDQITNKGHGLSVDDRVVFYAPPNATLPAGITEGTVYFVKTVPDSDNITIATTSGGTTIDITADGSGVMFKVTPLAVANLITPSIAIGQISITED